MNPTKLVLHFSEFYTIFTHFTSSCKIETLKKMNICAGAPAKKQSYAIGSLGRGRRRRRLNSGEPAAIPAGEAVGHEHLLT
jgi:hypothetical protein